MKKRIIILSIIISLLSLYIGFLSFHNNNSKNDTYNVNKGNGLKVREKVMKKREDNKDKDKDIKEEVLARLKSEEYYIPTNLDRYLNYLENNPITDYEEVVKRVNVGIDYEFYTHRKQADYSKNTLILVNKYNYVRKSFVPDLVDIESKYTKKSAKMAKDAYPYFKEMVEMARLDGITLFNVSAYRSFETQKAIYHGYEIVDGKENADRYSARAGYSEHQTGLALDINTSSSLDHFENSLEFAWLSRNAYKYGFILRYPLGKEYLTGFKFEPWHYRYVGVDAATYIYENHITFDEYYAYFLVQNEL